MQRDRITSMFPLRSLPPFRATPTSIVCGTDFSEPSAKAVEVAATLAQRLGEPLVLAHAVNDQPRGHLPDALRNSLSLYARAQLHEEKERLHALNVELLEAFRSGAAADVLIEEAASHHARLLVLTSTKRRSLSHLLRGHVVEHVVAANCVPTLLVRNPEPLLRWARGERRLRIFVAADFSQPSDSALGWVSWARQIGECQVVVACLEPTPAFQPNLDFYPVELLDEFVQKLSAIQEKYFRERVRALLDGQPARLRFEPEWGHSDAHLIQMATEERADLIVIGTHSHRAWPFLQHHPVARGVLHYAPLNVLCVPAPASPRTAPP